MSYVNWQPATKAWLWLVQFTLVIIALGLVLAKQPLKINSDLTAIFTAKQTTPISQLTKTIEQQGLKSQLMLVGASSLSQAIATSDGLAGELENISGIHSVKTVYDELPSIERISAQNLPYKQHLLSDNFVDLLAASDPQALFEHQFRLLNQMVDPRVSLTIEADPSLSLADFLSRSFLPASGLSLNQQRLVAEFDNKYYVLVMFELVNGGISIGESQQVVEQITALVAPINAIASNDVLYTGSLFYSAQASSTGQFEMTLFSTLSLTIMLALVLIGYRRLNALLSTLWVVGVSFVYGYFALSLLFDEISVVALIFSVTLIGISADYSFHGLSELRFNKVLAANPLRHIQGSLRLSYLTTLAGYSVLLFAPFVLFQQVAIFTVVGLFGAFVTVNLLFPWLAYRRGQPQATLPVFVLVINRWHQRITQRLSLVKVVTPFALAGLVMLVVWGKGNDDVRSFYAVASHITDSESRVKAILGQKTELQYILVSGQSPQALLENEERAVSVLNQLVEDNALQQYSAISQWLPSIKKQQVNLELMHDAHQRGLFEPIKQVIGPVSLTEQRDAAWLTPDYWFTTTLGQIFKGQWFSPKAFNVDGAERSPLYYSVIRLAGINQLAPIKQQFLQLPDSLLIDKAGDISLQIAQFRQSLLYIVLAGMGAALLVFARRFNWRVACYGVAIPAIALLVAIGLSQLLQGDITIFNMIAAILILALGLDYSVFYAEHGFEETITLTTLMSALSSIAVFAILMLSSTPAIEQFGLTVFIGVCVVFILAPQITKAIGHDDA